MSHKSRVLPLLEALIARRSVTPEDAGCCTILAERLTSLGFNLEWLSHRGVTNLWATRGEGHPLLVLAGHTDVVPPGPVTRWSSDPFRPEVRSGMLYGRGAADMKSGLAAMVCAVERLVTDSGNLHGTLAILVTSDEEGVALHGTRHVVDVLRQRGVRPAYAIVGEATAEERLGDRFIVGRRGSLGCDLKVLGKQGHVAYPLKADNPIHRLAPLLTELVRTEWDQGNEYFPPTTLQISNIHAGTGVNNVIPGEADAVFNFRYGTACTAKGLRERVTEIFNHHLPRFEARWWHSGEPFLTRPGTLTSAAKAAISDVTGIDDPQQFTGGGTSDARFLAPLGAEVIEIGPVSESIHKIDEHVRVDDLDPLSDIYYGILHRLLCAQ